MWPFHLAIQMTSVRFPLRRRKAGVNLWKNWSTGSIGNLLDQTLFPFLKPRGVMVVGVSASPEKLGYGIARNLAGSHYPGPIHFVGQRAGELFGRPVYRDPAQVPDPVDLAVLAVPAPAMPEALRACASRGIRAAIVVSAGFREAGPEGAALEMECLAVARELGMRLLGPNCIGTIDTHLPLDTSFLQPPMPERGGIAFVSQSGAFCAAIIDWSRREGFGFSQIVSLGNQADVNETDMLFAVAEDEHTRAIVLYLEGIADGRRFVRVSTAVTQRKPVIALKVGRFEAARKAAASHTGAMAASDDAFDAAFARAGILRAASTEQMFDWARALESCPLPRGRNVSVLTNAGGPGVIAADALEAKGLRIARLGRSTVGALKSALPPAASLQNPVDMLASASPDTYAACLKLLLEDDAVDAALVILPPPPMFAAESVAEAMIPIISASDKPVVVSLMGSELIERARGALDHAAIPAYPFPERAASALFALFARSEQLKRPLDDYTPPADLPPDRLDSSFAGLTSEQMVACYGIPTSPSGLARSPEEAAALAEDVGFPVVLKIASRQIFHKSDAGGVLLGIGTRRDVLSGYAQLVKNARSNSPEAMIEGVIVQKQTESGQEVILGAVQDPIFGPLMMFGSGGLEAEGMRDVAFALAPLNEADALELVRRTWAGSKLDGFRNIPPADKSAALDALVRLSWLAHEHPELKEIEINPLRVLESGAVALDVRHTL
jgi:acetyl coenzyme A synthetase (ADP forming)-like protein